MRPVRTPLAGLFLCLWALTVWSAPQRIVTLSPHAAELVCAAGGCERIVGVVDYTDFPPQLKNRPHVGNYAAINTEAILALRPDLIIAWRSGNPPRLLRKLEQFGIPILDSSPMTLQDIPKEIRKLGERLNTREQAAHIADILQAQIAALEHNAPHRSPLRVFYEIWHQPLITIGGQQFISQAITLCGGRNVFENVSLPSVTVSIETVLAQRPDMILIGGDPNKRHDWKTAWQKWPQLPAVINRQIHFVPADLVQRPGPRLIAGAALICHLIRQAQTEKTRHKAGRHDTSGRSLP